MNHSIEHHPAGTFHNVYLFGASQAEGLAFLETVADLSTLDFFSYEQFSDRLVFIENTNKGE